MFIKKLKEISRDENEIARQMCEHEECRRGETTWVKCCERHINLILFEHYHTNVGVCLVDTKTDRACDIYQSNRIMGVWTNACKYVHGAVDDFIHVFTTTPNWDDLYGQFDVHPGYCGYDPSRKKYIASISIISCLIHSYYNFSEPKQKLFSTAYLNFSSLEQEILDFKYF
ncbi:hypothetical protein BCR32DRAFT_284271 [Anaeromyces robustus]|uniref:Uncharacterized protein n=1 Tax=Anaeromyces robustus TaxID=1754192 RepID=A0A1Y1WS32_9FUNG|nr:hypothetical protein BCR32DRAFT_284271 [Anaeromyces robustus]|eukprot:ORX76350.1 hypothetical protein BCR32DRAFT_284271 [Anaeromyces robustus]